MENDTSHNGKIIMKHYLEHKAIPSLCIGSIRAFTTICSKLLDFISAKAPW